jgi:16S rRNA (guanine966-N2)-methyltransferase
MRIVAGSARGRTLKGPKGPGLRPTADRVRESVFNILGQFFDGLLVLDLYAGTGALALEALSRGAARAVLVDNGREALQLCRENAQELGMAERAEIVNAAVDARALARLAAKGPFHLVFAAPPYAAQPPEKIVELVGEGKLLAQGGWLVIEHDKRVEAPGLRAGLFREDQRRFGDTLVSFYRFATCADSSLTGTGPGGTMAPP